MEIVYTIDDLIKQSKNVNNRVLVLTKTYKGCELIIEPDLPDNYVFITEKSSFEESKKQHLKLIESNK